MEYWCHSVFVPVASFHLSVSLFPPSFSLSVSCRWWKFMACWLWGCLYGTNWSFQFSSCVSGYCCLLCRSTPTLVPEISLPQERGSFSSFLPGKTSMHWPGCVAHDRLYNKELSAGDIYSQRQSWLWFSLYQFVFHWVCYNWTVFSVYLF